MKDDVKILRKLDAETWESATEIGVAPATLKRLERAGFVASRERKRDVLEYRLTGAGLDAIGRKK